MRTDPDQRPPVGMVGLDPSIATAENYRRFARLEAAGRSPAYEALANAVAGNEMVLAFLGSLIATKRQPNLLFAAARHLLGAPPGPHSLHALVAERPSELAQVMNNRRTQTNEAARCAVLLPALAALPQPLALLEVGAAAGLTLLPDMYAERSRGRGLSASTLLCSRRTVADSGGGRWSVSACRVGVVGLVRRCCELYVFR